MPAIAALYVYPVKSCRGLAVPAAEVTDRGLALDRRWMVVNEQGQFLTQRTHPQMALLVPTVEGEVLKIGYDGKKPLEIPLWSEPQPEARVTVWGDTVRAWPVPGTKRWFTEALGGPCHLVYMPHTAHRPVDPAYAVGSTPNAVSFADGFPFLLLSTASLDLLNQRLEVPLPMNRFRPNIVVEGTEPHAEDTWRRIRIGTFVFHVVKPCARCAVVTVDQATGEGGKEPLRTLATYRKSDGKTYFGQNLLHEGQGMLRVGDLVEVLETA